MPSDAEGRSLVIQWVMFQMSGIGPMMGHTNVFFRYFPEKIRPAIGRYQNEVNRLFGVLGARLQDHDYLAGDYSIADIANWCWVRRHRWSGVELNGVVHLKRWIDRIAARPRRNAASGFPPRSRRYTGAKEPRAIGGRCRRDADDEFRVGSSSLSLWAFRDFPMDRLPRQLM